MDVRVFGVETTPATLQTVRGLAKSDLGITTPVADAEFDRRFNLYFNQKYAFDWKDWRARFPEELGAASRGVPNITVSVTSHEFLG